MSEAAIYKTIISQGQIVTPLLVTNEASIGRISSAAIEDLHSTNALIENLTVKELKILEDETEGNDDTSETYEEPSMNEVLLKFGDSHNCKYSFADHMTLMPDGDAMMLTIKAEVPTELGTKLVCRYLVLDLRKLSEDTVVGVTWPEFPIRWLYGLPDIQAGYFYVLAFQRFTSDLIIGNVAVKLEK